MKPLRIRNRHVAAILRRIFASLAPSDGAAADQPTKIRGAETSSS
jgi:hypothetical protein